MTSTSLCKIRTAVQLKASIPQLTAEKKPCKQNCLYGKYFYNFVPFKLGDQEEHKYNFSNNHLLSKPFVVQRFYYFAIAIYTHLLTSTVNNEALLVKTKNHMRQ